MVHDDFQVGYRLAQEIRAARCDMFALNFACLSAPAGDHTAAMSSLEHDVRECGG